MKKLLFILIILNCYNTGHAQTYGCLIGNKIYTRQINTVYQNAVTPRDRYVFDSNPIYSLDAVTSCVGRAGQYALHDGSGPTYLITSRISCNIGTMSITWTQVGSAYLAEYYSIVQCPLDNYGSFLVMLTAFSAFFLRRRMFG